MTEYRTVHFLTAILQAAIQAEGAAMRFFIAAAVAIFGAFACATPLKKAPWLMYILAAATSALYVFGMASGFSGGFWSLFLPLIQRCTLAVAFLSIVMFAGVCKEGSWLRVRIMPIRRQLSIIGCILACAHAGFYLNAYLLQTQDGILGAPLQNLVVSLFISLALTALLAVLAITSLVRVKSRMKGSTWKKIQKSAYLFYGLIYVHLAFILLPPAIAGKTPAVESIAVYTVLFAAYAILRARRAIADKQNA